MSFTQAGSNTPTPPTTPTTSELRELRVSPSSYELWQRCQRWWAFQYIEGIRPPSGDKANLGSRCHAITERYLRDGIAPDHAERIELNAHGSPRSYYPGRIVSNILHHLPPAGSVVRCEERLDFRYRGIEFVGIIDWQTDTHIGDHKFTGDLAYAKCAADLVTDPQAVIYRTSRWLESDAREVTLQWTYGEFTARASKVVRLPVVREFDSIDRFIPTIEAMQRAKSTVTEANTLQPTGLTLRPRIACEMYGGCPHLERCNRSATQVHKNKIGAFMQSTVLERLRARQAAQTDTTGQNGVASATSTNRAVQAIQNAQAAQHAAGAINPPGEAHAPLQSLPPAESAPAASTNGTGAPVPGTNEPVRRKRGRPPKNPAAPTDTTTGPVGPVVSTVPTSAPVADQATGIGTLYVNCRPLRQTEGTYTEAYELISAANALVCEDQSVAHYKFIEYGKGAGALCVALGLVLDERGYIPAVCVTTRSADSLDVMQVLTERSVSIVVGV